MRVRVTFVQFDRAQRGPVCLGKRLGRVVHPSINGKQDRNAREPHVRLAELGVFPHGLAEELSRAHACGLGDLMEVHVPCRTRSQAPRSPVARAARDPSALSSSGSKAPATRAAISS
jgi:hypothetical protein